MLSNPAATRRLLKEIHRLRNEPPEGIRISTNEDNVFDVTGIIAGPAGTPYEGGFFRVQFVFTEEFPASPPKCRMLTKIFHPNVSATGEICVNTLKKDWKPTYGIEHILVTIKCLLIYPNPESALDEEAGRELLENYDGYSSRARLITTIHATPKAPPSEFNVPSATSKQSSSSSTDELSRPSQVATTSPTPTVTLTPMTSIGESENDPAPKSVVSSTKPRSKGPPSLVSVVSAPPLQPATNSAANAQPVPQAIITPVKMEPKGVPPPATKAIKRTAAAAAAGADKRKKALRRL